MNHSEEYFKLIKDWIRPLQKSLTIETESKYTNTLGRKKFFNDYLYESLTKLENLKLSDEYLRLFSDYSKRYFDYKKLDLKQRKRLIIDTRKSLYKLGKTTDIEYGNKNTNSVNYSRVIDSNLTLNSDVSFIVNVGKVYKNKLNELGLFNIKDLIKYFPRTYLDYTNRVKIINLRPDNLYTCIGNIKKFYIYKSQKNSNLSIMNIVISDETSSIKVTKFFLGKRFRSYSFFSSQKSLYLPGTKLAISGKVKLSEYGKSFIDPQIEILNNNTENFNFSGKIMPLYSLSDSLSNTSFIKLMKKVIIYSEQYPDILNKTQLSSLSLLSKSDSLINIHFPLNQKALMESKKRLVFDELYLLQLKFLLRKRKSKYLETKNLPQKRFLLNDFFKRFPFKLTNSQVKVLDEIKEDLSSKTPMSRLLQGDVGSGKTIIAVASILTVVEKGFQGAFMVPTEVLAEQHYSNLLKFLDPLKVSVEILTGNTPQKKRTEILSNLRNGLVDILVGTHALFEEKVIFNSLGIVVIDEQHRFGVSQRNRLLSKGDNTNLLSMTATPIPRTLALSLYGDLDISQITELPPGRVPITTKIISENELSELFKIVDNEIKNGKQVYVILPLIEDSEKMNLSSATEIFKYLSEEVFVKNNVGLLHGKLNSADKNNVINSFLKNEINILVSTTVIEVGIDVPNASIMIIYNSERFGLSQLHQLRGRVGRGSQKSFCYLVTSNNSGLENKRLCVLQKSNDGFYIAEKDLELRGPGQLLGYKQSGLPDFVLDNLPSNKVLIEKAREEALRVLKDDPDLKKNVLLKDLLIENSDNKFMHDFLN